MRKIQWGVLGAGGIADRRTIPGLLRSPNARLCAVMEVDAAFAKRLRAKHGAARAYDDEDALLSDPEVEAVYIASPVYCHARQVEKAIAAGKHILVEKPVAISAEQSRALCHKAEAAGLKLGAGLMMRHNTHHRQMKRLIAEGAIGQVVSCRAQFTCWYPAMNGSWRQVKALSGGGAMMDMGIHCIDLIEYITGSRVVQVAGLSGTLTFSYEVEDACSALLRLENGAFATVDAYFNIPDEAAKGRLEIYGTGGSFRAEGSIAQTDGGEVLAVFADRDAGYDALQNRDSDRAERLTGALGDLYEREITAFGNAIAGLGPLEAPAFEAARAQSVVEAIYASAQSGRFVDLALTAQF